MQAHPSVYAPGMWVLISQQVQKIINTLTEEGYVITTNLTSSSELDSLTVTLELKVKKK